MAIDQPWDVPPEKYEEPPVRVLCPDCDMRFDEDKVECTGICEDDQGRDRLSFICPRCNNEQESFRYG